MSFIAWLVLGLFSGLIASRMVNETGEGVFLDVLLSIVGAFLGGWLSMSWAWVASAASI
jgi:uncharacterized membrane protein YeaQ/YmgE (transglycosylase-associated protein family)